MGKKLNLRDVEYAFDDDLQIRVRRVGLVELIDFLVDAGLEHLIDQRAAGETEAMISAAQLTRLSLNFSDAAMTSWTVQDEDGHDVPLTRDNIDKVLVAVPGFAMWLFEKVFAPGLDAAGEEEAEKNASAPLPNGSSAGAPDIAAPAANAATPAPAA